jgi:hypothetical protein
LARPYLWLALQEQEFVLLLALDPEPVSDFEFALAYPQSAECRQ